MELGLVVKPHGAGDRKGQLGIRGKGSRQPQTAGAFGLLLQSVAFEGAVEKGRPVGKIAVDLLFFDDLAVGSNRFLGGGRVLAGALDPQGFEKLRVNQAVLAGNFGRGKGGGAPSERLLFKDKDGEAAVF